jgi:hypothetical protein
LLDGKLMGLAFNQYLLLKGVLQPFHSEKRGIFALGHTFTDLYKQDIAGDHTQGQITGEGGISDLIMLLDGFG